jgi:hypothetical protein
MHNAPTTAFNRPPIDMEMVEARAQAMDLAMLRLKQDPRRDIIAADRATRAEVDVRIALNVQGFSL